MSDANIKTLLPCNPWISVRLFRYTVATGKLFPLPLEFVDLEINGAVTVILNNQSYIPGDVWLCTRQRFRSARFVRMTTRHSFVPELSPASAHLDYSLGESRCDDHQYAKMTSVNSGRAVWYSGCRWRIG